MDGIRRVELRRRGADGRDETGTRERRSPKERRIEKMAREKLKSVVEEVRAGFGSLRDAPRELWLIFALKVAESFAYFSMSTVLTLYLTDEFGLTDLQAGTAYGWWGTLTSLFGFVMGPAIDLLGVKRSLFLGFLVSACARVLCAITQNVSVMYLMLMVALPVGGALGIPVMVIGIKQCTTPGNRGFAFGLFYTVMNVAALASGLVLDFFRVRIRHGLDWEGFSEHSVYNNGLRLLLLLGGFVSAGGALVALRFRELGSLESDHESDAGNSEEKFKAREIVGGALKTTYQSVKSLLSSKEFLKFLIVCLITVNLKTIFRHLDATLPKYQIRAFGCNTPVGLIYSINPFMIIVLVPIVSAMTRNFNHFDMIHKGSYISALSPFWMVFIQREWAPVLFVVFLSLGEAIWSPRWYDYSMSVAPAGQEGAFSALSAAPVFMAKLPTGILSGYLLQTFCPESYSCDDGPTQPVETFESSTCNGKSLWYIIGMLTLTSPLLLLVFQRWLRPTPYERPPDYDSVRSQEAGDTPSSAKAILGVEDGEFEIRHFVHHT